MKSKDKHRHNRIQKHIKEFSKVNHNIIVMNKRDVEWLLERSEMYGKLYFTHHNTRKNLIRTRDRLKQIKKNTKHILKYIREVYNG